MKASTVLVALAATTSAVPLWMPSTDAIKTYIGFKIAGQPQPVPQTSNMNMNTQTNNHVKSSHPNTHTDTRILFPVLSFKPNKSGNNGTNSTAGTNSTSNSTSTAPGPKFVAPTKLAPFMRRSIAGTNSSTNGTNSTTVMNPSNNSTNSTNSTTKAAKIRVGTPISALLAADRQRHT